MSSGETYSGQYESRYDVTSILDLIAGPVVIGVVVGLFSPIVDDGFTIVSGVTNGVATGLLAGLILLAVMVVANW